MVILSHILHTVFWLCLSLSLTSPALISGSCLSHTAVSTCAASLRAVPCMLTGVRAASTLHLWVFFFFFLHFPVLLSPEGEGLLHYILSFDVKSSTLFSSLPSPCTSED